MRRIMTLVLIVLLLEPSSALAFFWQKKKKQEQEAPKVLINEELLIHGKYKGNQGDSVLSQIIELRLAIHIPRDQDYLTITTLYDEASENPIDEITWLREGKNNNPTRTVAFKTESIINKRLEEMSINYNPSLAYDRISEDKHVVNKIFYFKQDDAIGDREKPIAHFLDLYMPGDHGPSQKRIRIDNKLYYQPPQAAFIPKPHTKKKKSKAEQKREEELAIQEMQRRKAREAELEAERQAGMADLQYAVNQINGNNEAYGNAGISPLELQQIQQQQQLQQIDAFGQSDSSNDFAEDIY